MKVHESKELLHSKENGHQTEEVTNRMGENLCQYTSDKGFTTRIYRVAIKLNSQRTNDPMNRAF
jgi:hypothetical protein